MRLSLRPSARALSVFDIDYVQLRRQGIRAVLFDLDRTLGPGKPSALPHRSTALLAHLLGEGFLVAIVSNRRRRFADFSLDPHLREHVAVRFHAGKPRPHTLRHVISSLGISHEQVIMIGDRWLTDVLAAKTAGTRSILVRPWKAHRTGPDSGREGDARNG